MRDSIGKFLQDKIPAISFISLGPFIIVSITLAPLWLFRYVPGQDYPLHLAIGRILLDLITDNSLSATHYLFNSQLIPYWFAYVILVPLTYIFGADIAGSILLTLVGIGFFSAIWNIIRLLDLHPVCFIPSVFLFYNASFFWGFLTSLVSLPFILWGVVFLLRYRISQSIKYLALATGCGCIVSASNLMMLVPWGAFIMAWLFTDVRKSWRAASFVAVFSALPAFPLFFVSLFSIDGTASLDLSALRFQWEPSAGWLLRANQQLGIFGWGLGYAAALSMVILVFVNNAVGFFSTRVNGNYAPARWAKQNSFAGWSLLFAITIYVATPLGIFFGDDVAWGINFRYIIFVGISLTLLGPKKCNVNKKNGLVNKISILMVVSVFAYWAALFDFWSAFDSSMRKIEPALNAMSPGGSLVIVQKAERFRGSWTLVGSNVPSYYVARKGGMSNHIFSGGHSPITVTKVRDSEYSNYSALRIGDFDYMLLQRHLKIPEAAVPADGTLVFRTDAWKLYRKE
jgi:hypothetical protein